MRSPPPAGCRARPRGSPESSTSTPCSPGGTGDIAGLDDDGQARWVESIGADLLCGTGRLVGEREVEVTAADDATRRLRAERAIVVATGSRPAVPPVQALADIRT